MELVIGKSRVLAETGDVSFGGLFIQTEEPPPLRQLVKIMMRLPPEDQPVVLMGMAVFVERRRAAGEKPGIGVQLFGLSPETREHWERFVRHVRSMPARPSPEARSDAPEEPSSGPADRPDAAEAPPASMGPGAEDAAASVPLAEPAEAPEPSPPIAKNGSGARSDTFVARNVPWTNLEPEEATPPVPSGRRVKAEGHVGSPPAASRRQRAVEDPEHVGREPPWLDWASLRPELCIQIRRRADLRVILERELARGRMYVRTPLHLENGVQVDLHVVHPDTGRSFKLEGTVDCRVDKPEFAGLRVLLPPLSGAIRAEFERFVYREFVTVDLEMDEIAPPDLVEP